MFKFRGNRSRMKQCADARAAKRLWPKLSQMINRQFDAHSCLCITLQKSLRAVAAAVSTANVQAFDVNASTPVSNDVRRKVQELKPP